jgi:hypothetical protein
MTRQLGPAYSGLLPVVEAHVPSGFRVVLAHRCSYKGRNYVHLIARGGDRLISLVITKRGESEAFERDLRAVASGSDLSVYSSDARPYNIAGFATTGFLVYLVSDLGEKPNLATLEALAPAVRRVLL